MNRVNDPVDARVAANGLVLRIDQDDLEIFVGRILIDPVRVEDSQIGTSTTDTFLGCGLKGTLILKLIHPLIGRLACRMS